MFKDEDDQVIFNQYSFCELMKRLLVELVGISYEEAFQRVDGSPLTAPVSDALDLSLIHIFQDAPVLRAGLKQNEIKENSTKPSVFSDGGLCL